MSFTKLGYCQYLLSSPINDTLTNLVEQVEGGSHDRVNRYLRQEKLTPRLLWENVKAQVQTCEDGFIVFDVVYSFSFRSYGREWIDILDIALKLKSELVMFLELNEITSSSS